jgi:alkylation response protein AidB-like acyl-CoA dehydrogenase
MSAVGELELTEIGVVASAGIREILTRAVAGEPVARYVEEGPLSWDVIRNGGWDRLGVPESSDGAGASLRDLVEVALEWGYWIIPLPLINTIMAKRWSVAAREHDGPVTVSLRTRSSGDAVVIPFGGEAGIGLLSSTNLSGSVDKIETYSPDPFAPSLRLVESDQLTQWTPDAMTEMRIIWAAETSGCAKRILADSIEYVKVREQFGQPIGKFQAIKHHLANALLLVEQTETAVMMASLEPERAAAASRFAFDSSLKVIETGVQVHGGLGFTWEMGLHMYMRHVMALRELASGFTS